MYELSVGSKVFIFGEYQVLKSGKAFLAVLEPRFKLQVKNGTGLVKGIPSGSPADRYYQNEKEFFQNWDLEFIDPHEGRGGFGASTAQFALVHGFKESISSMKSQSQIDLDLKKLHKSYLEKAHLASGVQPSGADLMAQVQGGLVEMDLKSGKLQRHSWPFPEYQFLFFATGSKLATHMHLSEMKDLNFADLEVCYDHALASFNQRDGLKFAEALKCYQEILADRGWLSALSKNYLQAITSWNGVLAAKGCGAMGNDVIVVLVKVTQQQDVITQGEALGLHYVGNLDQRTEGFQYQWLSEG